MHYEIVSRSKRNKMIVAALLPSMLKQLKLDTRDKTLLIDISKCKEEGLAQDLGFGYVVQLNSSLSPAQLGITLAHELVHVHQMVCGKLDRRYNYTQWNGKKFFDKSTAYLNQPWEIQAFAKQEIVFRRAFETIRNKKIA